MDYELFAEYRYAGRNTAWAVIVPIEERGDEVLVTYKSAGAVRKTMSREKLVDMVSKNLIDDGVRKCLVKQKDLSPELCRWMDERLQEAGGRMNKTEWDTALKRAKREANIA